MYGRGAETLAFGSKCWANGARDVVALETTITFVDQIDLQIAVITIATQKVLAHESVEINGCGRPCIRLIIHDFRYLAHDTRERREHSSSALGWCSLRHVDDHLKLRLVVEGQHLQDHELEHAEEHRKHDRRGRTEIQPMAPPPRMIATQERRHQPLEPAMQFAFRL